MSDELWERDEPESPCVKICMIHPDERLCIGCLRTLDEIARWSAMTAAERRKVLGDLPGRAPRLRKRRGGHDARVRRN